VKLLFKFLLIFLISGFCFSVELLVKATDHWMDDLKQQEINAMDEAERASYDARSQLGDIIVVRPDGWGWGLSEGLPRFIIIKLPFMTMEEASQYESSIFDDVDPEKLLKHRKFYIHKNDVNSIIQLGGIYTLNDASEIPSYIATKLS